MNMKQIICNRCKFRIDCLVDTDCKVKAYVRNGGLISGPYVEVTFWGVFLLVFITVCLILQSRP
jgi:hypothetical protein